MMLARTFRMVLFAALLALLATASLSLAQEPITSARTGITAEANLAAFTTSLSTDQQTAIEAILARYEPQVAALLARLEAADASVSRGPNPVYLPLLRAAATSEVSVASDLVFSAPNAETQAAAEQAATLIKSLQAEIDALLSAEQRTLSRQILATVAQAAPSTAAAEPQAVTPQANLATCAVAAQNASFARSRTINAAGYAYINYIFFNNSGQSLLALNGLNTANDLTLSGFRNMSAAYVNLNTNIYVDDLGQTGRDALNDAKIFTDEARGRLQNIRNVYALTAGIFANQASIYQGNAATASPGCFFSVPVN